MARDVVLANPVRTAIGSFNGALKGLPATELGSIVVRAAISRSGVAAHQIASAVLGNVVQAGNAMNPARQAAILAGLPVSTPAYTVNRVCGSGAQAIVSVAQEIAVGLHDIGVAGGMENMDRAPYLMPAARWGQRMGNAALIDSMLHDGLNDAFSGQHSGWHTEDLASRFNIGREAQDNWALRSHQRFSEAAGAGKFRDEIVAITLSGKDGETQFSADESPRSDTNVETLSKLRPAFRPTGTITAGNAPGLNSGASAMIVAERSYADRQGLAPIARLAAYGIAGVEPEFFGLGPVPAIRLAVEQAGWRLSEIERFEINEAFAAVALAVAQELGLPHDIVNIEGGAIAHGHAIGATGAVLTTRLLHSMRRDGLRRGLVALCIGGGQGIALALEMLQ